MFSLLLLLRRCRLFARLQNVCLVIFHALISACVGLITQPPFVTFLISTEHSKLCFYALVFDNSMGAAFCRVYLLLSAAISEDKLLALLLGLRYRQTEPLRRIRVLVVTFWLLCISTAFMLSYNPRIAAVTTYIVVLLFIVTSTFCF